MGTTNIIDGNYQFWTLVAGQDGINSGIDDLASNVSGAHSTIVDYTSNIDDKINSIHAHLHGGAFWFGEASTVTSGVWAGDTLDPFSATTDSGLAYGSNGYEALVWGISNISPTGQSHFGLAGLIIISATDTDTYKMRACWGSGTLASAISDGYFTEAMFMADISKFTAGQSVYPWSMPELVVGEDQVWIQVKSSAGNEAIKFFVGIRSHKD